MTFLRQQLKLIVDQCVDSNTKKLTAHLKQVCRWEIPFFWVFKYHNKPSNRKAAAKGIVWYKNFYCYKSLLQYYVPILWHSIVYAFLEVWVCWMISLNKLSLVVEFQLFNHTRVPQNTYPVCTAWALSEDCAAQRVQYYSVLCFTLGLAFPAFLLR